MADRAVFLAANTPCQATLAAKFTSDFPLCRAKSKNWPQMRRTKGMRKTEVVFFACCFRSSSQARSSTTDSTVRRLDSHLRGCLCERAPSLSRRPSAICLILCTWRYPPGEPARHRPGRPWLTRRALARLGPHAECPLDVGLIGLIHPCLPTRCLAIRREPFDVLAVVLGDLYRPRA